MIQRSRQPRVALVVMPWSEHNRPNLPLATIKSLLADADIDSAVLPMNVALAKSLGFDTYRILASGQLWTFIGEWLFAKAAFPDAFEKDTPSSVDDWMPRTTQPPDTVLAALGDDYRTFLTSIRDGGAAEFTERVTAETASYDVVAFTCSVNQLVPSLAAARRIKEERPETKIILGGPQVESHMGNEILRAFPFIDAVYQGEGEVGAVEAFRWALGESDSPPPQLSYRIRGDVVYASEIGQLSDMNAAPVPDYTEYFDAIHDGVDVKDQRATVSGLLFESARGCWWGEKHHCTFCGLNGKNMAFRSKDPELLFEQVLELSDRYKQLSFHAADNIISKDYSKTFLPMVKDADLGIEFFYETKANLRRSDIKLYQDARVRAIQPGIESFSSHTLQLMDKGVTALQNVYLLKLCREYDIDPEYNILLGFPGETTEDYLSQAYLVSRLHHLSPPGGQGNFMLQRFSPMHFDAERFGIKNVRAHWAYSLIFPKEEVSLDEIAFYFNYDLEEKPVSRKYVSELGKRVKRWKRRWQGGPWPPELTYQHARSWVYINDTRSPKEKHQYILDGLEMQVLLLANDPISVRKLKKETGASDEELDAAIEELDRIEVIAREGQTLLSLATPRRKTPAFAFTAPE